MPAMQCGAEKGERNGTYTVLPNLRSTVDERNRERMDIEKHGVLQSRHGRKKRNMSKQDILDYFSDINYAYNDSTRLDTLSRMLDELVEQAASPWHRVEEELPKHGQRILICLRFTNLDREEEPAKTVYGYFENFEKKGRRYWTWEDEEAQMQACMSKESDFEPEYGTTRITHWMPLPEPPKEDA